MKHGDLNFGAKLCGVLAVAALLICTPWARGDVATFSAEFPDKVTVSDTNGWAYHNKLYVSSTLHTFTVTAISGAGWEPSSAVYWTLGGTSAGSHSVSLSLSSTTFTFSTNYIGITGTNYLLSTVYFATLAVNSEGQPEDIYGLEEHIKIETFTNPSDPLPDWWQVEYFGTLGVSGSGLDASGNTFLYDYDHGLTPGLAAPTGLVWESPGNAAVELGWNAVAGATGYEIERSGASGGPYSLVGSGTTASFIDFSSSANTDYYYVVAATDPRQSSADSAEIPVETGTNTSVGQWLFAETSGTIAHDTSGFGSNATVNSGTYWAATGGYDGRGALAVNGTGQMNIPNTTNIVMPAVANGPFSFTLWMKPRTIGTSDSHIVVAEDDYDVSGFRFGIGGGVPGGGTPYSMTFWTFEDKGSIACTASSMALQPSTWCHAAVTYDGATARIYVDGTLAASATGTMNWNSQGITVGYGAGKPPFDGTVDNIIFYPRALSGSAVAASYNTSTLPSGAPDTTSGLPDWWKYEYFGMLNVSGTALAPAGDGNSNYYDYENGLNPIVSSPVLSPASSSADLVRIVMISCPAAADSIHYTTNGATPTVSSSSIASGHLISIPLGTTVEAVAISTSGSAGYVVSGAYTGIGQIATGQDFTLAIKPDGTLWTWGSNNFGQLGTGDTSNQPGPEEVLGLSNVTAVAGGQYHGVAVSGTGAGSAVWTWGSNNYGQLGLGGTNTVANPTRAQVTGLSYITGVAAGASHTLAISGTDGSVWGWGYNADGELGNGGTTQSPSPVKVRLSATAILTNITQIAGGANFSVGLKPDGSVWSWGAGISDYAYPYSGLSGIVSIAAGSGHVLALKSDGTVWAFGLNGSGQLGQGTFSSINLTPEMVSGLTGIIAIAAGGNSSFALKSNGTVVGWGDNSDGQLGDGTTTSRNTPGSAISGFSSIDALAAGYHVVGLKSDGTLWAVGGNSSGQLGIGTYTESTSVAETLPLSVPPPPTITLTSPDGAVLLPP